MTVRGCRDEISDWEAIRPLFLDEDHDRLVWQNPQLPRMKNRGRRQSLKECGCETFVPHIWFKAKQLVHGMHCIDRKK